LSGDGDDVVGAEMFFGVTASGSSAEKILHWMSWGGKKGREKIYLIIINVIR